MKKLLFTSAFLVLAIVVSYGFLTRSSTDAETEAVTQSDENAIHWVTIEEAAELSYKEPRKVLVDVYTDWCGWCKKMDKDTYENAAVVDYINKNYYAVKFDAEQKEDVVLGDRTFKFRPDAGRRGVHELAVAMLDGKMGYPTTVFFDEKLQIISPLPGYQGASDMLATLHFFEDEVYKTSSDLQKYVADFKAKAQTE